MATSKDVKNSSSTTMDSVRIGVVVAIVLYRLEWCVHPEATETSAEMIVEITGMSFCVPNGDSLNENIPMSTGDTGSMPVRLSESNDSNGESNCDVAGCDRSRDTMFTVRESDHVSRFMTWMRLVLSSLVLEQARICHVWYAIVPAPSEDDRTFYQTYFNMICTKHDPTTMICDLHNVSVRYTFLQYHEINSEGEKSWWNKVPKLQSSIATDIKHSKGKHRWLVRLPCLEDVMAAQKTTSSLLPSIPEPLTITRGEAHDISQSVVRLDECSNSIGESLLSNSIAYSPGPKTDNIALSAVFAENDSDTMKLHKLNIADGSIGLELALPNFQKEPPSLDIMRTFPLCATSMPYTKDHSSTQPINESENNPILLNLMAKQKELADMEQALEPTLCRLLSQVVVERVNYESVKTREKANEELLILRESQQLLERRKEQDLAWQKQLEQDMDAVCEICGDGEVIPENQILFCEACNVAVHQMCYGIEKVPEGDYYCIACRRLGRDKRRAGVPKSAPMPLPICCELCPLRQGAFVRTDVKSRNEDTRDRWVHVLCAKWQGLDHVDNNQELVEDVSAIRLEFRRHRIKCELCLGERGGMIKCIDKSSCNRWFHVTCARAVGTLKVVHGENCLGGVDENPWQLFCPEHSNIAPDDVPDNALSVDTLIRASKEFPPEAMPPPVPKPFTTLSGPERKTLLADFSYEQELIRELLEKKFSGVRCEICDLSDDESKTWTRCIGCNVIFCRFCKLDVDETKGFYKCPSCQYVDKKTKAGQEYENPRCCTCVQNGGLLRESHAKPIGKKFMKKNPGAYMMSLFVKQSWVHSLCAM
jgi:PHD-zinc-finger like domain/PHD-finger